EAIAAFSEAARACFAFFLPLRSGASSAAGDASGVGAAVGTSSSVGAEDAPLKKLENRDVPEVPPAHPARKISDNQRTPSSPQITGRSIRSGRARDRWFRRRIGCNR